MTEVKPATHNPHAFQEMADRLDAANTLLAMMKGELARIGEPEPGVPDFDKPSLLVRLENVGRRLAAAEAERNRLRKELALQKDIGNSRSDMLGDYFDKVNELEASLDRERQRAEASEAKLVAAERRVGELQASLREYVIAQGRMRDRWSEGDQAVRDELWRNLHACEEQGRRVLSLPAKPPEVTP